MLYTTIALRQAIRNILDQPQPGDRRVAMVAYVGGQAQDFLPDPKGLELVSWLQPGATDALTLGRLKERGAVLFKSKKLHMKVYWSSRKGCVVCSANASGNALGGGGLIEAGVRLPPGVVGIDRLWKAAKPELVSANDLRDLADKKPTRKQPGSHGSATKAPSFMEWTRTDGAQTWKLGWWDDSTDVLWSEQAKEKALYSYRVKKIHNAVLCAKGEVSSDEWLLLFDVRAPSKAEWFYADFVIQVPKREERAYHAAYPYQAVVLHPLTKYPPPPFDVDKYFGRAFGRAVGEVGQNYFQNLTVLTPKPNFINLIKRELRHLQVKHH